VNGVLFKIELTFFLFNLNQFCFCNGFFILKCVRHFETRGFSLQKVFLIFLLLLTLISAKIYSIWFKKVARMLIKQVRGQIILFELKIYHFRKIGRHFVFSHFKHSKIRNSVEIKSKLHPKSSNNIQHNYINSSGQK